MEATISAQLNQIINLTQRITTEGIKVKDNFLENILIQGSGAFFGALFAFLFGLLTFWVKHKRERFIKHKNAVVELEYILNEHLDDIAKNRFLLERDIKILEENHLTYDRLHELRIATDIELRLGDLEVINQYVSYKGSVVRVNSDFNKLNSALENLDNIIITRGTVHTNNFTHLAQQMITLNKYLGILTEEAKNLLAFIRIYLKRIENKEEKGFNPYKTDNYTSIAKKEIARELIVLNKEVDQNMKSSQAKIKEGLR